MRNDEAIALLYEMLRYRNEPPAVREALRLAVEALKREDNE